MLPFIWRVGCFSCDRRLHSSLQLSRFPPLNVRIQCQPESLIFRFRTLWKQQQWWKRRSNGTSTMPLWHISTPTNGKISVVRSTPRLEASDFNLNVHCGADNNPHITFFSDNSENSIHIRRRQRGAPEFRQAVLAPFLMAFSCMNAAVKRSCQNRICRRAWMAFTWHLWKPSTSLSLTSV